MIRNIVKMSVKARPVFTGKQTVRNLSRSVAQTETEEWSLFPRQREGNIYAHNWSLCEDGVVPEGDAYRNARLPIITTEMRAKINEGKIEQTKPQYFGNYKVNESGDDMSHEIFSELFSAQQQYLSSGINLFVEDAILGSHSQMRNGVRITTSIPAVALIARSLLIPSSPMEVNHRARFKGWNFDPRWKSSVPVWNGQSYDLPKDLPPVAQPGQRPIVAFVGGDHAILAVQFVENNSEIVGANIVVGSEVPVRGLIEGVGHAACVLANTQQPTAVTLPCTAIAKGKDTAIVIGGGDEVVAAAAQAGTLYGAYHNTLSPEGVAAIWGGYISPSAANAKASQQGSSVTPIVVVEGKAAVANHPNNLAYPAKHIVFFEKGASKGKLSTEEALTRLVALSEEVKTDALKVILQNATVSVIGNAADVNSIF